MYRKIAILGSTGSIGTQALKVIECFGDRMQVTGLAAGGNWRLLAEQIKAFRPRVVSTAGEEDAVKLADAIDIDIRPEIYYGPEGLLKVATLAETEVVLTAVSGAVGLEPTIAALKAGKDIALANKETLVTAGPLVIELAAAGGNRILPVDSEHSAVWQCLRGEDPAWVKEIVLTASGGPFRSLDQEQLARVSVDMALAHPNWNMGAKITIDSATLMNKGLEVIEARWLFDVEWDQIRVVVHPQSVIHSMVEFVDGSVMAQLGQPDMRVPIQLALTYPKRFPNQLPRLDWFELSMLTFEPPDFERFPCLKLALDAGRRGGTAPAVLNAANEIAVQAFLSRQLNFLGIAAIVEGVLAQHQVNDKPNLKDILDADQWARATATNYLLNRR